MRKSVIKMKGLTLLETLFALVLGAIITFAVIILFKSIKQNSNVSQVMSDMNSIRAGYKSYLNSGYQFDASTDAAQLLAVQTAGFLPNPLNDPWGIPYFVSLTKYKGYITIAIPGLNTTRVDSRCMAIWKAAQVTGAFSTSPGPAGYNCAFNYRFP